MLIITEKRCRKCDIVKPVTEFYPLTENQVDGYRYRCKQCEREYKQTHRINNRRYYEKHKLERSDYSKEHYRKNKSKKLEYSRRYYQDNVEEIHKKAKLFRDAHKTERRKYDVEYYWSHRGRELQRHKEYYSSHKQQELARGKKWVRRLNLEVLTYYGGGELVCVRCGYDGNTSALSIDHIEGNGRRHRRSLSITKFYHWLVKNGFPDGFQTLCHNCQWIKRAENQEYYQAPKSQRAKYQKEYRQSYKRKVLTHYGNGKLACTKCGYNDIRALSIDHINGKGSEHRDSIKHANVYVWLVKNGYPEGYQTLCMRCQWIKRDENKELERTA